MRKSKFFKNKKAEKQKKKLTPEEQQMLMKMLEDGDLSEEDLEGGQKLSKKEQRKNRKQNSKSPLKSVLKQHGKKNSLPMVGFAGTLLLMLFCLIIYSVSYLITPDHILEAQIKVVKGGYELTYDLEEANLSIFPTNTSIGDEFYFTDRGTIVQTTKNSVKMRVVDIDGNSVRLEFCASDIPKFISTSQMKGMLRDQSSGKQFSTVKVTGKVLLNRFSLIKIEV